MLPAQHDCPSTAGGEAETEVSKAGLLIRLAPASEIQGNTTLLGPFQVPGTAGGVTDKFRDLGLHSFTLRTKAGKCAYLGVVYEADWCLLALGRSFRPDTCDCTISRGPRLDMASGPDLVQLGQDM